MRSKIVRSGVVTMLAAFVAISSQQVMAWEFSSIYHQAKDAITGHDPRHEEHRSEERRDLSAGNPGVSHVELDHVQATVAFSPDGGGEHIIVDAIDQARSAILVQAYGFTDKEILRSLVNAKKRGVDVKILLDKSNDTAKYSGATYVANAGIPVWIDDRVAIAHNKVMIIDKSTVITVLIQLHRIGAKAQCRERTGFEKCAGAGCELHQGLGLEKGRERVVSPSIVMQVSMVNLWA